MGVDVIGIRLTAALQDAGFPISGVTVLGDQPAQWTVNYLDEATKKQRKDGDAFAASFDPVSPAIVAAEKDSAVQDLVGTPLVVGFVTFYLTDKLGRAPKASERDDAMRALSAAVAAATV
jgi:hypothetical protein